MSGSRGIDNEIRVAKIDKIIEKINCTSKKLDNNDIDYLKSNIDKAGVYKFVKRRVAKVEL